MVHVKNYKIMSKFVKVV